MFKSRRKFQRRIQDPVKQSMIRYFCKNLSVLEKSYTIDASKGSKCAFALSNVVNLNNSLISNKTSIAE